MTATLPRSRTLDPVLPPMPRRQSCDRCHEQKVRCVSERRNGVLGLGGIAEEGETNSGRHVVSSVPCVRCRKAGACCVYSPQLRSGRPRLQRDSSAPPPRKRARRVSRCSSSPSLSPTFSQSPSPPSSSPPSAASSFTSSSFGLGIFEHSNQLGQEHAVPQISPQLSPSTTTPGCGQRSQRVPDYETPPIPDQWLMSPFEPDSSQFLSGMCQLASFSQESPAPAIPCVPLYTSPSPDMPSTAENVDYPWDCPNAPDYSLEELAQINLRIHLAGRALATPARALVSVSSPAIDDIFGAACSLINLVDRYTSKRMTPLAKRPDDAGKGQTQGNTKRDTTAIFEPLSLPSSPVIDSALDSSICLMIHACHQALLGVFEDLSTSFLVQLPELQQPTPPGSPSGSSVFSSGADQVGVITNLMSHLLSQLDRTIGSLSSNSNSLQVLGHKGSQFSTATMRQTSPDGNMSGPYTGYYEPAHPHFGGHQSRGQEKVSAFLFHEMEQRQLRVRDRVKSVEGLLRQPNVL